MRSGIRIVPRSLSGRFLAVSLLTTLAALLFAAVGIGHVLERFVIRGLDQQLDAEIATLGRALRPDGTLDPARIVHLPAFENSGGGWGWRVESARGRWGGGDVPRILTPPGPPPAPHDRHPPHRGRGRPGDGVTAAGEPVHLRAHLVATRGGTVTIVAGGPRRLATAPLRAAMVPLLGSLAILGVGLALATLVQLRIGLRPLRTLRDALADVRAGRARHVPGDQPAELAPLAAELNALVDQNAQQLDHARRHVANLAHGLKTPLAALGLRLAESGRDPDGSLRAVVADIDGRVRHHLGRARAAAPGGRPHRRTPIAPAVAGLAAVMRGVHADRAITATIAVPPGLAVTADAQDIDEMLGNLIDNAWRHAHGVVAVAAVAVAATVEIAVEDDGPGLPDAAIAEALVPGRRLDERGDGHGFGLPIAQELAELSGGALRLERSRLGGLRAVLALPAAPDDHAPA